MTPATDPDRPFSRAQTERELNGLMRGAGVVLFLTFGVGGLWAALAPLGGAVIAPGAMKVETNTKLVQHLEGGIVRRILVKDGQRVEAGQVVVELEDIEASASLAIVNDQLDSALAKLARLQSEIDNAATVRFPETLLARKNDPSLKRILQREEDHFRARNAQLREQITKLGEQRAQAQAEIASYERQLVFAEETLASLRLQEKSYEGLVEKNFVAPLRMLEVRRAVSEKEEKKHEYQALLAQARQKLADVQLRLSQVTAGRYAENSRDIVEAQTQILNLQERRQPFKESLARRILLAPSSGIVNASKVHTEGGVVGPRETILEITPDKSELIAEVHVSQADIDEVRLGQDVQVEFSGMNRRVTPLIHGKVSMVSPDLNSDPANPQVKFFTVRIELKPTEPLNFEMRPGLPVAAYIRTRERTALELWLDPLIGGVRKSLRET